MSENRWSPEVWTVVGSWINQTAEQRRDPVTGLPWIPSMGAVESALDSVARARSALMPSSAG